MQDNQNKAQDDVKILVIGCGKMGTAIVKGWIKSGVEGKQIYIVDFNAPLLEEMQKNHGVNLFTASDELPPLTFDYVMVALKPQQIAATLSSYDAWIDGKTQLISVAAGITCDALHKLLPRLANVIRIMPNTPCLIQKGVSVGYTSSVMDASSKAFCQSLFSPLGFFSWVESEALIDDVTGVSGSGPAYLFQFVESFVKAAENTELPAELAKELAISTVLGAAHLLESQDKEPAQLRKDVTSPKGTTEAGLKVLIQDSRLDNLMNDVVQATKKRSEELAKLI